MQTVACGRLQITSKGAKCTVGRDYPSECLGCSDYLPTYLSTQTLCGGRQDARQHVLDRMAAPSRAEIEEIHAELEHQDKAIQQLTRRLAHLLSENKTFREEIQGN